MKNTIIISAVVFGVLTGCKKEVEQAPAPFRLTETISKGKELATAEIRSVQTEIALTGKISFNEDKVARVFPLAGGFVRELFVELGDRVQKGQILAIIRSPEIAGFNSEGIEAEAELRKAEKNAQVAEELFKTGNISEVELMNARKDLESAKAEQLRIKEVLDMYSAGKESIYPIKSPVSGVILQKNIALSMELRTEDISPVFLIGNLDDVWVMANIYESDIQHIQEGFDAEITTISYPDKVFKGKIDKIFNLMDPESKTVKARVVLPNKGYELKPEMFAKVLIRYTEPVVKMAVPSQAIIFDKSRYFVMVYISDDKIETREVTIYKENQNITYLQSGLNKGDQVMVKYQLLVYDALND
jgi:cobalt-zinc-cadmium efflux system membrane fusion protein